MHYIANYLAKSEGDKEVQKKLENNKGMDYFPGLTTLDHVTYTVFSYYNHYPNWTQSCFIESLSEEELLEAKNYKELGDEGKKYAPRQARYTQGVKVKREFGVKVMSPEGGDKYREIATNWASALGNPVVRETVEEA